MCWRRLLPGLFMPALLCVPLASAAAGEVVVNGGFETGDFTGWNRTYDSNTHWYVFSGTTSPASHHTIPAPFPGSYQAVADQGTGPNTGAAILYQDVTLPDAYHVWLKVRYYFANYHTAYINPGDFSTAHPNQQVRIDIMDPAAPLDDLGSGVLRNLVSTSSGTPLDRRSQSHPVGGHRPRRPNRAHPDRGGHDRGAPGGLHRRGERLRLPPSRRPSPPYPASGVRRWPGETWTGTRTWTWRFPGRAPAIRWMP